MNNDNNGLGWEPPAPGKRLRDMLNQFDSDEQKVRSTDLYKQGYYEGQLVANEEAKCVVRALMRMFDNEQE